MKIKSKAQSPPVVPADLQQTLAAFRASEIRYRRIFETAHDGVLLLDPGTRKIVDANPFMTKLLGYSHKQLVGKELFQIGLLEDEMASRKMFRKLKLKREVRYEDLPLKSRGGRHQEVEVVANLYQEDGHAIIQCNIRDITERKAAELAANRLVAIVKFSDDAIIGKDTNGIVTSWNQGAEKIFGYTAREMVGASISRLIPAGRQHEEAKILAKIRRSECVEHFDTVRQTKVGRLINVSVTVSPIKDAAGRIIGISKVARDITTQTLADAALRASEERYRILFELGPVAVYSCAVSGVIQDFNRRAVELWGRTPKTGDSNDRFCGSAKLFRPDGSLMPREVCPMAAVLKGKLAEVRDQEVILERPNGSRLACIVNIRALKNDDGKITGAINCFYDITERKAAAEAHLRIQVLAASNEELTLEIAQRKAVEAALKKSERHYGQLLAESERLQEQLRQLSRQILLAQEDERKRISRELHDVIAQTLTGINVRLAALKKEASLNSKHLDRDIARTQRLVEKSVNIVHEFARELRPAVLDDLGLIPALHSFVKLFSKRTGVLVRLQAFAAVEQLDIAKRTVLYRVAQEALTNVSRHAQAGRVDLDIRKLAGGVGMTVKDDGKSFSVERYLTKGSKRLGLLGMRERVEMVGGTFCVESAPGQGTTINVEIPYGKTLTPPAKMSGNNTSLKCP